MDWAKILDAARATYERAPTHWNLSALERAEANYVRAEARERGLA
jgi:hypothetical protein